MKNEAHSRNMKVVFLLLFCLSVSSFDMLSFLQADVIERLRLQYKKDLLKVVDIVLSHQVRN